jgi:hypothetical protein
VKVIWEGDGVNEAEWMSCNDAQRMLEFLRTQRTARERKLRLVAAACCRQVWDWLGEKSRRAIDVLEQYVDRLATADELHIAARGAGEDSLEEFGHHHPSNAAYIATTIQQNVTALDVALGAAAEIAEAVRCEASISKGISIHGWPPPAPLLIDPAVRQACIEAGDKATAAARWAQCHLLRDVFHGPRRAVYFRRNWLFWNDHLVPRLAQAAYDERLLPDGTLDAGRLGILADALLDAGCDVEELLSHLRNPGPHVRGCWAVDAVLSRS